MRPTLYTIGQIYRLGLLKNHLGKAYGHKATVSKIVNTLPYSVVDTAFGPSKAVSMSTIKEYNKRHKGS